MKVEFWLEANLLGIREKKDMLLRRTGTLIKEYPHFYAIRTKTGYIDCVNKHDLICGQAKLEVLK